MNILIVYATYSSGTLTASEGLVEILTKDGHTPTLKNAADISPDIFADYDLVILGSPSWMIENHDGQPHHLFLELMKKAEGKQFENTRFAIFGLGDTAYAHFCGAVDHLEDFVHDINGQLIEPSLKIDGYYFNQETNDEALRIWLTEVLKSHLI